MVSLFQMERQHVLQPSPSQPGSRPSAEPLAAWEPPLSRAPRSLGAASQPPVLCMLQAGPPFLCHVGHGGAPLETPQHSGRRDPQAVPSEMLAPWFGPIRGALGCGAPPSQAFPGAAAGTAASVALLWAAALGTNQPDTSTAGRSLQNHRDASAWRTGVLFAGHQGMHTARVAL